MLSGRIEFRFVHLNHLPHEANARVSFRTDITSTCCQPCHWKFEKTWIGWLCMCPYTKSWEIFFTG